MDTQAASVLHPIHHLANVRSCNTAVDYGKNMIFVSLYYENAYLTEGKSVQNQNLWLRTSVAVSIKYCHRINNLLSPDS